MSNIRYIRDHINKNCKFCKHTDYGNAKIAVRRIDELEKALNDLLNDCINFDDGKLTDVILKQASDALKDT